VWHGGNESVGEVFPTALPPLDESDLAIDVHKALLQEDSLSCMAWIDVEHQYEASEDSSFRRIEALIRSDLLWNGVAFLATEVTILLLVEEENQQGYLSFKRPYGMCWDDENNTPGDGEPIVCALETKIEQTDTLGSAGNDPGELDLDSAVFTSVIELFQFDASGHLDFFEEIGRTSVDMNSEPVGREWDEFDVTIWDLGLGYPAIVIDRTHCEPVDEPFQPKGGWGICEPLFYETTTSVNLLTESGLNEILSTVTNSSLSSCMYNHKHSLIQSYPGFTSSMAGVPQEDGPDLIGFKFEYSLPVEREYEETWRWNGSKYEKIPDAPVDHIEFYGGPGELEGE